DTAAERERHEAGASDLAQHVERRRAGVALLDVVAAQVVEVLAADVEEEQLVHVPVRVALDGRHRVADHLVDPEPLAADDEPVLEQQAGDEARPRHAALLTKSARTSSPASWLFSGWNCTPWTGPRRTAATTGPS